MVPNNAPPGNLELGQDSKEALRGFLAADLLGAYLSGAEHLALLPATPKHSCHLERKVWVSLAL